MLARCMFFLFTLCEWGVLGAFWGQKMGGKVTTNRWYDLSGTLWYSVVLCWGVKKVSDSKDLRK